MRVLLQRVSSAAVSVENDVVGRIGRGYLLFLGVMEGDTEEHARWLAEKISKLRLFEGGDGTINDRSVLEIDGEVLVVSQFTLAGRVEKGNRPDYTRAAHPAQAIPLYEFFLRTLRERGVRKVEAGRFGAQMRVALTNEGPVTLLLQR